MEFLYLSGIVIAIIVDYIVAKRFSDIAEMKGHKGSTYFWFTLFLGIVGMLMVIALPNVSPKGTPQPSIVVSPAHPSIQRETYSAAPDSVHSVGADEWKCTCGKIHKNYESSCACGVAKHEAAARNK